MDSSKKELTAFRSIAQLIICPLRVARGTTRSCVHNITEEAVLTHCKNQI
jgi:hypothetical protein